MITRALVRIAGPLSLALAMSFAGLPQAVAQLRQDLAIEDTLAWEMLDIEKAHRTIPADASDLLRAALQGAIRALGPNPQQPKTAAEAVAASQKMATALARLNFLQPVRRRDWPDTLGQAFRPVRLKKEESKRLLRFDGNVERARYIERSKPIYYVDCDIAALLLMSAAQALGWDVRLVEMPDHNFIRWHLADGELGLDGVGIEIRRALPARERGGRRPGAARHISEKLQPR